MGEVQKIEHSAKPLDQRGAEDDQIGERLGWTPKQRLQYLLDMLAFEERAHRANRVVRGTR